MLLDQFGNRIVTTAQQIANVSTPAQSETVTLSGRNAGKSKSIMHNFRMKDIDALETNRQAVIYVLQDENVKMPDSIARRNHKLYGNGTVTVAAFIKNYPRNDGGVTRARGSLLWDLNRNIIGIVGVNIDEAPTT